MQKGKYKMGCITVSVEKDFKKRLARFPWVNWSEIGREEILKKYIFDKYVKTGNLSKDENEFCERIDWHPVDELPLKKEVIDNLKKSTSKQSKKMNGKAFEQWLENL